MLVLKARYDDCSTDCSGIALMTKQCFCSMFRIITQKQISMFSVKLGKWCEKYLKDNQHDNLHLPWKHARISVLGHYLFLNAISFPRATLSGNCSPLGTDNVRGQISEHISAQNGGYCLFRAVFNWVSLNQNQSNQASQSQRTQTVQWANQSSKLLHMADAKCGKTCASKSRSVLVSLVIGWKSGASFLSQSCSIVLQNQLLYDTQNKKTALWKLYIIWLQLLLRMHSVSWLVVRKYSGATKGERGLGPSRTALLPYSFGVAPTNWTP